MMKTRDLKQRIKTGVIHALLAFAMTCVFAVFAHAQGYNAAVQWLLTQQLEDGYWGLEDTVRMRDTQRTLEAR